MFNVCGHCGMYTPEKEVLGNVAVCPFCGGETVFVRQPLFLLSGACGVGKTEVCRHLPALTQEVVALEGDILWESRYNSPENKYRPYREMWLRVCKNISQAGRPCLLCGCADPDQFEPCVERRYFSRLYYLALVAEPEVLAARLRSRPGWRESGSEDFIRQQIAYNQWFLEHHGDTAPPIDLLDNTNLSPEETARAVLGWIRDKLAEEL
ncbi:MAG: AAA family ATPase [Oscillospiraceae bacterium]|nr:AAA family ATPase [Oscillospiraceae bacterium]